MGKQSQEVAPGGQAVQAGHDVAIYNGMLPEQMAEMMTTILVKMAAQLSAYTDDANRKLDERLNSFQREVINVFSKSERAQPEAFADPDFQFLLRDAQDAYARSGEEAVRDTLVDIIARRSQETTRSRLAMALNDAARKAPLLTINEFAALSLSYIARYTQNQGVGNFELFAKYVNRNIIPLVKDVANERSSFLHLEAQGCAKIEPGTATLREIWKSIYCGVLSKGCDQEILRAHLPEEKRELIYTLADDVGPLFGPSLNEEGKLQPYAVRFDVFKVRAAKVGLSESQAQNVWNAFANTMMTDQELIDKGKTFGVDMSELFKLWDESPLKSLSLNTVGMAIAHANAVRVVGFSAPLNIWIK
jgi:hypothetical protein